MKEDVKNIVFNYKAARRKKMLKEIIISWELFSQFIITSIK